MLRNTGKLLLLSRSGALVILLLEATYLGMYGYFHKPYGTLTASQKFCLM